MNPDAAIVRKTASMAVTAKNSATVVMTSRCQTSLYAIRVLYW